MDLANEPCLVIEASTISGSSIHLRAKQKGWSKSIVHKIRKKPICVDRLVVSMPTVYVLEPAEVQVSFLIEVCRP